MSLRDLCLTELKLRRIKEHRSKIEVEVEPISTVEHIHREQLELADLIRKSSEFNRDVASPS